LQQSAAIFPKLKYLIKSSIENHQLIVNGFKLVKIIFTTKSTKSIYKLLRAHAKIMRPLQNAPFRPISVSGSNCNPQNTQCIPVVKIFAFLELEQN
jgi:hypothetical protein